MSGHPASAPPSTPSAPRHAFACGAGGVSATAQASRQVPATASAHLHRDWSDLAPCPSAWTDTCVGILERAFGLARVSPRCRSGRWSRRRGPPPRVELTAAMEAFPSARLSQRWLSCAAPPAVVSRTADDPVEPFPGPSGPPEVDARTELRGGRPSAVTDERRNRLQGRDLEAYSPMTADQTPRTFTASQRPGGRRRSRSRAATASAAGGKPMCASLPGLPDWQVDRTFTTAADVSASASAASRVRHGLESGAPHRPTAAGTSSRRADDGKLVQLAHCSDAESPLARSPHGRRAVGVGDVGGERGDGSGVWDAYGRSRRSRQRCRCLTRTVIYEDDMLPDHAGETYRGHDGAR